jgi:membrane-associated phospholipid phosphatase
MMRPPRRAAVSMGTHVHMAPDGHSGTVAHRRGSRKLPFAKGKPRASGLRRTFRGRSLNRWDAGVSDRAEAASEAKDGSGQQCRFVRELRAKLAVLGGLTLGICAPYFTLQNIGIFPSRVIPSSWIDHAIGFEPSWTPIYLSVCGLVPLSVMLATRREELVVFSRGLAAMCVVCFAAFLFFPAVGPRPGPEVIAGLSGSYPWLISVDGASNAFPSLHAALTIFCLGFTLRVIDHAVLWRGAAMIWGGAILYSTLATKQHFALDIAVGAAVGWIALAWSASRQLSDRARSI